MKPKSPLLRVLYRLRDLRSGALFRALREHCRGEVLDVGGWDYVLTAIEKQIPFERWTTLEHDCERTLDACDPRVSMLHGDGCAMELADASFDTVLNIQVLEHVLEPLRMVDECARVLRPGGKGVFLVATTSTMHLAPHYHGNFSRYWIQGAMQRAGLEIVELRPIGGVWSSMASHAVFFFLQAARVKGFTDPGIERSVLFWLLVPFQIVFALVCIPICMLFALGDLAEEPNNHLVIVRKPVRGKNP